MPLGYRTLKYLDVLDYHLLSSDEWYIEMDPSTPAWIKHANTQEYQIASYFDNDEYFKGENDENLTLKYQVCNFNHSPSQAISEKIYKNVANWNTDVDPKMIKNPIWSTWAKFRTPVNQSLVLNYASDIKKYWGEVCSDQHQNCGQIEIDDKWQIEYGDLEFDFDKFPNPQQMVKNLHENGFTVTIWTTPFVNREAAAHQIILDHGWMVKNSKNTHANHINWWQCKSVNDKNAKEAEKYCGYILDFFNPEAFAYQTDRFEALKSKYEIDGFKFDAGEKDYIPTNYQFFDESIWHMGQYTQKYAEFCGQFGGNGEMRAAFKQQAKYPGWTRFLDLTSSWAAGNGLRSIIPKALTFSITGYPWLMSDMIGGNQGGVDQVWEVPERELFIRWAQLAMFLPTVQFSLTPWEPGYDAFVQENAVKMAQLRNKFVLPILLEFQEDKSKLGTKEFGFPVTPLWWLDLPENPPAEVFTTSNQYLVGTKILVAPIDRKGETARDIYFPGNASHVWRKIDCQSLEVTDQTFTGGQLIKNHPLSLSEVGLFIRE